MKISNDINSNFKGWHSRGYIPHFDSSQVIQVVTFRLIDSLPDYVIQNLYETLKSKSESEKRRYIDRQLDECLGKCYLSDHRIAEIIEDAFKYFHDQRYYLIAWVVMPNHVHVMIETNNNYTLSQIIHSWKSYTAKEANKILQREGVFWQADYWDRFIRDELHFYRVIEYIHNNPVKAGLCKKPEDWLFSSARHPELFKS